jgi:hypothetical protein
LVLDGDRLRERTDGIQAAGRHWPHNNHYSGVYLGPDQKTAYVGVIGGLIAIRDSY